MKKKIVFISKDNLTTNPRLLKELKLAVSQNYEVDFIGFYMGNWSDQIDKEVTKNISANFHYIPIIRKFFFKWFFSSIIEKTAQKIYPFFKNNLKINAYAHSKRSFLLNNYLKKTKKKYDLIIAHTLPSLYPAYRYAKKINAKFIFDIEDYHPGEAISETNRNEEQRRIFLMQKILPHASYITYASPLIGEWSMKLIEEEIKPPNMLINNCFSEKEFRFFDNKSEKIKFVWFSQNIAQGRGLELVVPELNKFKDQVELTLIGNLYPDFYDIFLKKYSDFIKIIAPLPQKELNLKLSEFDVGLAIEDKSSDFNRDICLTNKIWAYFQAGLYIFATDTKAQQLFMQQHRQHGIVALQNVNDINRKIVGILQNIKKIREEKQKRFERAKIFAWENESKKLLKIWTRK